MYGDLWTRYLNWGVSQHAWYLQVIHAVLYTLFFFGLCRDQRRAVQSNLAMLRPGRSRAALLGDALAVFWNFAWAMIDTARHRVVPGEIEWEIEGSEHFETLRKERRGAIILTAHMGSYDLAGTFFAERFGRLVHAVRAPERNPELQVLRERELNRQPESSYGVHFNTPGSMLGLTLAQALGRGEIVAIQADRMLFDIAGLEVDWRGLRLKLPRGPFVLARAAGCPMFPLFVIRTGRYAYRIRVEAPLECGFPSGAERDGGIRDCAGLWMERLGAVIERHRKQWFVFEPLLQRAEHGG
ncbi:MAG TPA: lysophospholipid acyltransferase family protein [Verrucomicrobiales bacterium]|nr:lysophospholipid acyltransferase family protein [Verrucomicrobiales bacterium]